MNYNVKNKGGYFELRKMNGVFDCAGPHAHRNTLEKIFFILKFNIPLTYFKKDQSIFVI